MTVFVLDTHVLLWWLTGEPLTPAATAAIIDPSNDVYVSVVTGWEIAIKSSQGKLTIDGELTEDIYANGFDFLPIRWSHASQVGALPSHHRDPFDRMLIAQCQSEGFTLISRDLEIAKYEVDLLVA
jgi:PIN domain nuclease of toxin-antitoxin system